MTKEEMMMQGDIKNKTMSEDLISGNFSDNVNKRLVSRHVRLVFILLISFIIFTLLNFTDWYLYIRNAGNLEKTLLTSFEYKIYPVIIVIDAALAAVSLNSYLKGQKLILQSFEKDNTELFNKGYVLLNESLVVNVIGYAILIFSSAYRLFLSYIIR